MFGCWKVGDGEVKGIRTGKGKGETGEGKGKGKGEGKRNGGRREGERDMGEEGVVEGDGKEVGEREIRSGESNRETEVIKRLGARVERREKKGGETR